VKEAGSEILAAISYIYIYLYIYIYIYILCVRDGVGKHLQETCESIYIGHDNLHRL
jgi:hypothetical protein